MREATEKATEGAHKKTQNSVPRKIFVYVSWHKQRFRILLSKKRVYRFATRCHRRGLIVELIGWSCHSVVLLVLESVSAFVVRAGVRGVVGASLRV